MTDQTFYSLIIGLSPFLFIAIATATPIKTTKKIINKVRKGHD